MNNFIFENSTKAIFGKGCVKEYLCCLVNHFGGDNVLLAYGGGSIKKNGIYDEVYGILRKAGKNIVEFPGIMPNPTYAKVLEGAKLCRENDVDLILAVGGGSVMDCCKAVSLAARYQGDDLWADFFAQPGVIDFEPLPLGIIVTVSGTGSEMNGGAVITNEELKVKTGRDYPKCNAKFALMDPAYYRHICLDGVTKFARFATRVWGIPQEGQTAEELAKAGVEALADFIREIGLPTTLRELGMTDEGGSRNNEFDKPDGVAFSKFSQL
jgi:alcohol dehydrogenase YqhD (iron-dependent ADH family)